MDSSTVEFQRFGHPTGILRLTDRYLRTIGVAGEMQEVEPPMTQVGLDQAMKMLDYGNFRLRPGNHDEVVGNAQDVLGQLTDLLSGFLPADRPAGGNPDALFQLDVVTQPRELAQLPFEVLEEARGDVVVTRRVRQPWCRPDVVDSVTPRVLFAWAEPVQEVPHGDHREALEELLTDWGDEALVEVKNASIAELSRHLSGGDGFTHVHLLAHGTVARLRTNGRIDLLSDPEPTVVLELDDGNGDADQCSPDRLAEAFGGSRRPRSLTLATCHAGEVDSVLAGATFAHVLHSLGVPIVVASQLALTQAGSLQLVTTFVRRILNGDDPRAALRECRDVLRKKKNTTYYDRVAIVGYVHLDNDFDATLRQRQFSVAFKRLTAASRHAVEGGTYESVIARFADVRERLTELADKVTQDNPRDEKKQLEELHGLQASSWKREAEVAWSCASDVSGAAADARRAHSRERLADAATAYEKASAISLDHHWVWVQALALRAVTDGNVQRDSWIIANAAAEAVMETDGDGRIWGRGSRAELLLLSLILPAGSVDEPGPIATAKQLLTELAAEQRRKPLDAGDPIQSTREQLNRYVTWWGVDDRLRLPQDVVRAATELRDHLVELATNPERS